MELKTLTFDLTVCKVPSVEALDLSRDFYFIGKTDEEISLVCRTEDTPEQTTQREDGWKGFRIQGVLDFTLIGIFAVSTYNTDYILVKDENFDRAMDALKQAGYTVV